MLDDDNPSPSPITLKDKILGKLGMLLLCAVVIAVMSAAVWFVGQATGVDFYSWNRTTIGLGAALGVWAVMYLLNKTDRQATKIRGLEYRCKRLEERADLLMELLNRNRSENR
jgi:hypothetical protein